MRPDLYTKAVLTVIAVMLTVIACSQYVSPRSVARAAGPLSGVQVAPDGGYNFSVFDSVTGDLWHYSIGSDGVRRTGYPEIAPVQPKWTYVGKITKLGEALAGAPPRVLHDLSQKP